MAAVDLDASLSADSSVTASAAVAWALASGVSANSTFSTPMLLATRAFGAGVVADSVCGPSMLQRARPIAAPVVADSSSSDSAKVAWALASAPSADSAGSGAMSRARPIAAAPVAGAVFAPAFMNSTDGLLAFAQGNSQVVADMFNSVPLAASLVVGAVLTAGAPDIHREPPPNKPQPLPNPNRPLRIIPNNPGPPQLGIGSPPVRRRGL